MKKGTFTVFFLILWSLSVVVFSNILPVQNQVAFKKMKDDDPRKQLMKTIFTNRRYPLMSEFSSHERGAGGYESAWNRAKQYFGNGQMFFNPNPTYLASHTFTEDGKLMMEVYNGEFFKELVYHMEYFTEDNVIAYSFNGMNPDFRGKMGYLSDYFQDKASMEKLKRYLGNLEVTIEGKKVDVGFFDHLLDNMKEENFHLISGALMHEGMHARVDDPNLAWKIHNQFVQCHFNFHWDELRAYMSEIKYHCKFIQWASKSILHYWNEIYKLMDNLNKLRRPKPPPITPREKEQIEMIKARIKANIALLRLRLREMDQSAKRMEFLAKHFIENYCKTYNANAYKRKKKQGARHQKMLKQLQDYWREITNFQTRFGSWATIMYRQLWDLEGQLDHWNKFAACDSLTPPADTLWTEKIWKDTVKTVLWKTPIPPAQKAEEIKEKAESEIKKYVLGEAEEAERSYLTICTGGALSFVSMNELNDYISYLNSTWQGDVPDLSVAYSFWATVDYRVLHPIGIGLGYEYLSTSASGSLQGGATEYETKHSASGILASLIVRSDKLIGNLSVLGALGIGTYSSSYTETENSFEVDGNDHAIGFKLTGGIEYNISPSIGFTFQAGYRSLKFDDFSNQVHFYQPNDPPVVLDYSGFTVQAGLCIHLLNR